MTVLRKLSIEAGTMRRRIWRFWVPDGLHLWWGRHGVHLFLFGRPHVERDYWQDW